MQTAACLQAALNGDRIHPAAPRTPTAIAAAARAAVDAALILCTFMLSTMLVAGLSMAPLALRFCGESERSARRLRFL
jgi:hypothetical protein